MQVSATTRWISVPALRTLAVLGGDALATLCGFHVASALWVGAEVSSDLAWQVKLAGPLLLALRVGAVLAARLHRWSSSHSGLSDVVRLAAVMCAASLVFAVACPGLPLGVYAFELPFTTGLMVAFRYAVLLVDERHAAAAARPVDEGPRRALNIAVALIGLVATLPLWVLIAIAIRLTSRGPAIYRQQRVGLDCRKPSRAAAADPRRQVDLGGRPFMMYKFRTMTVDAEAKTGAVWSMKRDPRVTPIGRVLRHCRLDELPQLINVLKGDMNIVGPRPERPSIFAELRQKIPNYQVRQRVRPGITGAAQVTLEYDSSIEDVVAKVECDLEYLSKQSVWCDLRIMIKTVPVMLFRRWVLRKPGQAAWRPNGVAKAEPQPLLPTAPRRTGGARSVSAPRSL